MTEKKVPYEWMRHTLEVSLEFATSQVNVLQESNPVYELVQLPSLGISSECTKLGFN